MVLKFSQQIKHAQRTEKYIRLIFNSYISDTKWNIGLGLWYLYGTTIFQAYCEWPIYIVGGNRSTRRKPPTCRKLL